MYNDSGYQDRALSVSRIISSSISVKQQILANSELISNVLTATDTITEAFAKGHKVFFCGNGGSAADAQHLAAEFSGRFYKDRDPLPSEALHVNSSYLTAVANDYGFDYVFSRLLKGVAFSGDVLVGLSTSGNSKNVALAFQQAREMNVSTIGLTGANGGLIGAVSDILLSIPSIDTPRIQESHIMVGHIICELVESALFELK